MPEIENENLNINLSEVEVSTSITEEEHAFKIRLDNPVTKTKFKKEIEETITEVNINKIIITKNRITIAFDGGVKRSININQNKKRPTTLAKFEKQIERWVNKQLQDED